MLGSIRFNQESMDSRFLQLVLPGNNFAYIFQVMALTQEDPISDVTKSCQNAPYFQYTEIVVNMFKIHVLMVYIFYIHVY